MSKHEHKTCDHELHHCVGCDVVYCEVCDREWRTLTSIKPFNPFTTVLGGDIAPDVSPRLHYDGISPQSDFFWGGLQ